MVLKHELSQQTQRFVAVGMFNPSNAFHRLVNQVKLMTAILHGSFYLSRQCLAYCYFNILEQELHEFCIHWNQHYMRKTHGSRCPPGVPDDLHTLPEITG